MRDIIIVVAMIGCGRIDFEWRSDAASEVIPQRGCVAEVAAYGDQICARRTDGAVWCWGSGADGMLGDGYATTRLLPGPSLVTDAIEIENGEMTACAIRADRSLACWGDNTAGQIGDGTTTDRNSPTAIALGGIDEVKLGQWHTCARGLDGTLYCWGTNSNGGLGIAVSAPQLSPVPVSVVPSTMLAVGDLFTCALRPAGTVECWGRNFVGELGDGTLVDRSTPAPVLAIDAPVRSIAAGCHQHVCAVTDREQVWCWGYNADGQLGRGTMTTSEPTPAVVAGLPPVAQVTITVEDTCVRTSDGEIWCWGLNESGEHGNGTFTPHLGPVRVLPLPAPVVDIQGSCGGMFARLADGTLYGWGSALQLGTGETVDRSMPGEIVIPCN